MEVIFRTLQVHLMSHLRTIGVNMRIGMQTARHIVGMTAYLFHDINLTISGLLLKLTGIIQNAGHVPLPFGSLMLASI